MMQNLLHNRSNVAWLILVVATVASLESRQFGAEPDSLHIGAILVLGIAFGKSWIIGQEFMELRRAPSSFKIAFNLWILALLAMLVGIYANGAN